MFSEHNNDNDNVGDDSNFGHTTAGKKNKLHMLSLVRQKVGVVMNNTVMMTVTIM
jgi:hypothetical protein